MLSLGCRDTGAGVLGCEYVAKGETEEELWKNGTEHLIKAPGPLVVAFSNKYAYNDHGMQWDNSGKNESIAGLATHLNLLIIFNRSRQRIID